MIGQGGSAEGLHSQNRPMPGQTIFFDVKARTADKISHAAAFPPIAYEPLSNLLRRRSDPDSFWGKLPRNLNQSPHKCSQRLLLLFPHFFHLIYSPNFLPISSPDTQQLHNGSIGRRNRHPAIPRAL